MIASDESDSVGITNFECQEKEESFHRIETTINEIAHEKIIGGWNISTNLEQLFEIIELPMDITAHLQAKYYNPVVCLQQILP